MSGAAAPERCSVLIVGAGPVGSALGCLLLLNRTVAPGEVLLLDARLPDPAQSLAALPTDLRVFALSRASERIVAACGAWEAVQAVGVGPYERMCVWSGDDDPRGPGALVFDAQEQSQPNLGHIVPNNLLQGALLRQFASLGGRSIGGGLAGLEFTAHGVQALTDQGRIDARLIVGADGAQSAVRKLAGIGLQAGSYRQAAIVANIASDQPHERTAWQRFVEGGTLALLPLASGESSIVWSLAEDLAQRRMALAEADFEAELSAASASVLGPLRLRSARVLFPLRRQQVERYARDRCVLAGDAAHVIHPLAGQGVNLGLLDAASLADVLAAARAEGEDPGAPRALRNYERWRRSENGLMSRSMDGLNRFLATGNDAASSWARRGMSWVGSHAALRGWFAQRALGLAGDLPRAARRG